MKKSQIIKIGDIIEFEHIDTKEVIKTEDKYNTFKELFDNFHYKRLGLRDTDDESVCNAFYTKKEQEKYEALGIEIKLI